MFYGDEDGARMRGQKLGMKELSYGNQIKGINRINWSVRKSIIRSDELE